jgi:hypothetical protein
MHYFPIKELLINDLHLEGYIITKSERIVPTKSANRKWMSDRPEIESQGMGPHVNAVCQISKGCDRKLLRKFFPCPPAHLPARHPTFTIL